MEFECGGLGKVVSLGTRMESNTFPAISKIDAYWEQLRDGRLMPKRSEVDPRAMESALEYALLLEHVAPGVVRVRVAGTHLSDLMGMEVRGMPLSVFFDVADRGTLAEIVDRVVREPQVAELKLSSPAGLGRPALDARMLLAPLEGEHESRPRLLGCLQSRGGIGRNPRRFRIEDKLIRRIVASAKRPTLDETEAVRQQVRQFAEPTTPFKPAPTKPKQPETLTKSERPYLRLVRDE